MAASGRPRRLPLRYALPACVLACAPPLVGSVAWAQPVIDLALSDAQIVTNKGCAILKVDFNLRIRYASHFPLSHGSELLISLNPIDRDQAIALQLLKREAVRSPDSNLIRGIDFETRQATGPVLRIHFDHAVAYQVAQSADIQSIVVAISGPTPSPTCRPEFPAAAGGARGPIILGDHRGVIAPAGAGRPGDVAPGRIADGDLRAAAAAMDEARAALKTNNLNGAIRLLTKVVNLPENEYSAEAHELLGLARQRSGDTAAARAEYELYLSRYPKAEGSERVRQRLDAILTADGEPTEKLRSANRPGFKKWGGGAGPNGETTWTFSGSASEFYIRDDSFRTAADPSIAPDPTADADSHQVHQNELLTSLDLIAAWSNDQARGKVRFSGTEEHHFVGEPTDRFGVAALFSDVEVRDWAVLARVGRQIRNTGGVLGRFDGGLLSWEALPYAKFNLITGSPVLSRFDQPFRDQKWFYGASIDLGPFLGVESTLYAIEQRDRWLVDREAVGAEARYFDQTKSAFATVDYDIKFQELNAAIFSGSWTLFDKSTIYGGADYRKTPYLSLWNALLNQPFTTLYDMLRFQTAEQLQQLAANQTPTYKSAMLGYSRPLTDHFQISGDATVVNLSQPIVLPGVDPAIGSLPASTEYYYSLQLMGSSLLKDGDMYIAGFRYSRLSNSNLYVVDFNTRYPLWSEFHISPRLRLGYRVGRDADFKEYTVLPSILLDYYWTKELSFEFELGAQRTWNQQAGVSDVNTELFLTAGIRYDFYADDATRAADKRNCGTPVAAALCRYSNSADRSNCTAPPTSCR